MTKIKELNLKQKGIMNHFNVPAIDGIPGIMPGTVKVPPPPEFIDEEEESQTPEFREKKTHFSKGSNVPKHKRRMMPCNKVEKKKSE